MRDISEEARELARLDREVVRAIVEGDYSTAVGSVKKFREVRLRLAKVLADVPAVNELDPEVRCVLNRLSQGPPFAAEQVLDSVTSDAEGRSLLEPTDDEFDEIGTDLLYSWISHIEYVRNLFSLNVVVLSIRLPDALLEYLSEARRCFAFQQYNAVVALSRTILEAAARDLCERLGFLGESNGNVVKIDSRRFYKLLGSVSSGRLYERAEKAYGNACNVIHGRETVDRGRALQVLRETLQVVQDLYSYHGL